MLDISSLLGLADMSHILTVIVRYEAECNNDKPQIVAFSW